MAEPQTLVAAAPFRFHQRSTKLDWRSIQKLDLERIEREVDIDSLERHLESVAFSNVCKEGGPPAPGRPL